jgi:hypothetical protein
MPAQITAATFSRGHDARVRRFVVLGLASVAACADEPGSVVEYGVFAQPIDVEIPASALVDQEFSVVTYTQGGCITAESTDVSYADDDTAIVELFDRRNVKCKIQKLCAGIHQATVRFTTPGNKTVLLRGRVDKYDADHAVDVITTIRIE